MPDDHIRNAAMRAGRYVAQPGGYRAFIPAPLPPDPPVRMDSEMWRLVSDADRALGRLDGVTQTLPNPDLFLFMYVRKEALLSSQIEGTQASLLDVLEYEQDIASAENPQDVEEVVNYIAAMNFGLRELENVPISLRLIRSIHSKLLQGVRGDYKSPGEFRRSQNWIGPPGCTLVNAAFVPPPHHQVLEHLGLWEKFLHEDLDMPALIKVGLAHAQFETIHPFLDGNGRLGRLLITFLLCESKILRWPSLYISYYFKKYKSEYYTRLQNTRDMGDWEGWLKFFLRGVKEVAAEATATASEIMHLRERNRALIARDLGRAAAGSANILVERLYERPVITVQQAANIIGSTYANANNLIRRLTEVGLLQEMTGNRRNRRFAYTDYLSLFSDAPNARQ